MADKIHTGDSIDEDARPYCERLWPDDYNETMA